MTGCKCGKRRFNTEEAAQDAMKEIRKHPRETMPVRIYYCTNCGGFHFTKKAKKINGREIKNAAFKQYLQGN